MSDLALIIGGAIGCMGLGYAFGRWIKLLRQLFDSL